MHQQNNNSLSKLSQRDKRRAREICKRVYDVDYCRQRDESLRSRSQLYNMPYPEGLEALVFLCHLEYLSSWFRRPLANAPYRPFQQQFQALFRVLKTSGSSRFELI